MAHGHSPALRPGIVVGAGKAAAGVHHRLVVRELDVQLLLRLASVGADGGRDDDVGADGHGDPLAWLPHGLIGKLEPPLALRRRRAHVERSAQVLAPGLSHGANLARLAVSRTTEGRIGGHASDCRTSARECVLHATTGAGVQPRGRAPSGRLRCFRVSRVKYFRHSEADSHWRLSGLFACPRHSTQREECSSLTHSSRVLSKSVSARFRERESRCRSCYWQYTVFIGTTTTGSSLVHYWQTIRR